MTNVPDHQLVTVDIHVGSRIKLRRMLLGMSRSALAARLSVDIATMEAIERGDRRSTVGQLCQLAEILGVHERWFFDEGDVGALGLPSSLSAPQPTSLDEVRRMTRAFAAIQQPDVRDWLVAWVEQFVGDQPSGAVPEAPSSPAA